MNGSRVAVMLTILAVMLAGAVSWGWFHTSPMPERHTTKLDELRSEIERYERGLSELREERVSFADRARGLESFGRAAVAADPERVESHLRAALNRLAREAGLSEPRSTAEARRAAVNPASTGRLGEFQTGGSRSRRSDPQPSFTVVEGSLAGSGTTAQVLDALARLESQPWPKRITGAVVEPTGGGSASLRVEFETVYLPDIPPRDAERAPDPVDASADLRRLVRLVLASDPFTPPPVRAKPVREPEPVVDPDPGPPPPPPYGDWVVSGVVTSGEGPTVWVRNRRSGAMRSLSVGEELLGLTLVWAEPPRARFRGPGDAGNELELLVGQDLSQRR